MHKNPSKQRFIAASARCSTKQLSSTITKCLKEIDTHHAITGKKVYSNSGINSYWIIGNSSKVHRMIDRSNERKNVENIATYDFSTLDTNIPHDKLKRRMENVIRSAYNGHGKKYLSVYNTKASFVNNPKRETKAYSESQPIEMVSYLIDNCYVTCGNRFSDKTMVSPWVQTVHRFLQICFYSVMNTNGWWRRPKSIESLQRASMTQYVTLMTYWQSTTMD